MSVNANRYREDVHRPLLVLRDHLWNVVGPLVPGLDEHSRARSVVRVYRDARFAGNGAPYRTRVGVQLRHRASSPGAPAPSVSVWLEPGASQVQVGLPRAAAASMTVLRDAIRRAPALTIEVVQKVESAGGRFVGEPGRHRARADEIDPRLAPHLARASMAAAWSFTDDEAVSPMLVPWILARVRAAVPLLRFQCLALGLSTAGQSLPGR